MGAYVDISDPADDNLHQPHWNPSAHHDRAEDQPTHYDDHQHSIETQRFPYPYGTYPPYSTVTEPRLPLDSTVQTGPTVAYGANLSGNVDPTVSSSPFEMENERTVASSAPSPQTEASDIEPRNPRKRKRVMGQDEQREENRARRRGPQQFNLPQTPNLVSILKS